MAHIYHIPVGMAEHEIVEMLQRMRWKKPEIIVYLFNETYYFYMDGMLTKLWILNTYGDISLLFI